MNTLRLTLALGEDESPSSFASRLAALNTAGGMANFLLDLGLTSRFVADGYDWALDDLATLAGISSASLATHAARRIGGGDYMIREERVPREFLRRSRLHVCPACLQDDFACAAGPQIMRRPELHAYGRMAWLLRPIRTCAKHNLGLVEMFNTTTTRPSELYDFAHAIRTEWPRIDTLLAIAPRREPSVLETYILDRIRNGRGAGWLDTCSLYGVVTICELVGAVSLQGPTPNLKLFSEDERAAAGAAGYAIASQGEEALRRFFSSLQETCQSQAGQAGPQAIYGRLYQGWGYGGKRSEASPLRDVLRQHIVETTPVGPGTSVLGMIVEKRSVHSIYTLSRATGQHPARLRKILIEAGLVPEDATDVVDNRIVFNAEEAERLVRRLDTSVPLKDVAGYLNCPRVHARLLYEREFLRPVVDASVSMASGKHAFAKEDLDDFLERLLRSATPMSYREAGFSDLPGAAKKACCSAMEIVALVLEGRLKRLGRDLNQQGYLALLVDVEEVRALVRLNIKAQGMTLREIERRIGTNTKVVEALIRAGDGPLPTLTVVNPVNRCPQTVVPFEALDAFEREYIGLTHLARERGVHHIVLRKQLDAAGVVPALRREKFGATFYRRIELPVP
ncbi:hypothetical protein AA309_11130 [Microvirga vignae]|uniref:TniQ domain-containing protein n=2 Tax=Microvirga vignae TaxID=1225564 RepID=A0A0H1RDI3_9HYPH|nr:hypothetical protein AA309_11130 [Microvirga vignae]